MAKTCGTAETQRDSVFLERIGLSCNEMLDSKKGIGQTVFRQWDLAYCGEERNTVTDAAGNLIELISH